MDPTGVEEVAAGPACPADRSCGCEPVAAESEERPRRRGVAGALFAVACAAACLAGPLAVGGLAAMSGALAGEWWIAVVAIAATAVVAIVLLRRRGSGSVC